VPLNLVYKSGKGWVGSFVINVASREDDVMIVEFVCPWLVRVFVVSSYCKIFLARGLEGQRGLLQGLGSPCLWSWCWFTLLGLRSCLS